MAKKTKVVKPHLRPETPAKIDVNAARQVSAVIDNSSTLFQYVNNRDFPYQEKTFAEYQKKIQKFNLAELQRHAVEVAHILPNVTERNRLTKKLEDEYLIKHGRIVARNVNAQNLKK